MVAVFLPEGSQKRGMFLCWVVIRMGFSEPLALSALATSVVGEGKLSKAVDEEDPTFTLYVFLGLFCGQMAYSGWRSILFL